MGFSRQEWLELVAIPFSRGIFPTLGSNLGLPHCRQIVYHLNHQGSTITEVYYFFFFFLLLPSMCQFLDFISREIFLRIPEIVSVSLISTSIFLKLLLYCVCVYIYIYNINVCNTFIHIFNVIQSKSTIHIIFLVFIL